MSISRVLAVTAMFGALTWGTLPGEDSAGESRLVLKEPPVSVPSSSSTDPYDDLGDFAATYSVRYTEGISDPAGRHVPMYGKYVVRRRGGWVSASLFLEQPLAADAYSGVPTTHETWLFHNGEFEGLIEGNILTKDPSHVGLSFPMIPFTGGGLDLGIDRTNPQRPRIMSRAECEALAANSGYLLDEPVTRADGRIERRTHHPTQGRSIADGTRALAYVRTVYEPSADGSPSRRVHSVEGGVRVPEHAGAAAFELPFTRTEVSDWKGKLPARLVQRQYRHDSLDGAELPTRAQFAAAFDARDSRESLQTEYVMELIDVRTPASTDPIEMRDWAPFIAAIRDGNHSAPVEFIEERDASGQRLAMWRLNEDSQEWERAATN